MNREPNDENPIRPGTRVRLPDSFTYLLGDSGALEGEVIQVLPRDRALVRTDHSSELVRAWIPWLKPAAPAPLHLG